MRSSSSRILVVGAGAAGIAAAADLARQDIPVTLIEARERTGGRILTGHVAGFPCPVEDGAEFIHGFPTETLRIARGFGLPVYELPDRHLLAGPDGTLHEQQDFWAELDQVLGSAPPGDADISFAENLSRRNVGQKQRELATSFVEGFHAAEPGILSQRALYEETRSSEEPDAMRSLRILSGYESLLGKLLQPVSDGTVELILNEPVERIIWEKGNVTVQTRDNAGNPSEYGGRRAIITIPPGCWPGVRFEPESAAIAEKRKALRFIRSGDVFKIILLFREPFWESHTGHDLSFVHAPDLRYFPTWWSCAPFQWPLLTGWTGAAAARELSRRSENELLEIAAQSLSAIFREDRSRIREEIAAFSFHDWIADPFSHGAYSYLAVGGVHAPAVLASPVEETLFFAGEATESSGITGTVEGALLSGRRAAAEVKR